jgi:hypothetical protein
MSACLTFPNGIGARSPELTDIAGNIGPVYGCHLSLRFFSLAIWATMFLAGCESVGPKAIDVGRVNYNDAIEQTSMEQTLLNIVRVHEHMPMQFMDISEVDVGLQFEGQVSGTFMAPHATAGHDRAGVATLQYEETPTIRYLPLQGPALAQLSAAPIGVDSLAAQLDSDWPIASVLAFAVQNLTPNPRDYYKAYAAIRVLYEDNRLIIGTAHIIDGQQKQIANGGDASTGTGSSQSASSDALVLYYIHDKSGKDASKMDLLWEVLHGIYKPWQSRPTDDDPDYYRITLRAGPQNFTWDKTSKALTSEKDSGNKESDASNYGVMPFFKTRSALGIVRDLTHKELDWDLVVFVTADEFENKLKFMVEHFEDEIRRGFPRDFYIFDPCKHLLNNYIGEFDRPNTQDDDIKDMNTVSGAENPWYDPIRSSDIPLRSPLDDVIPAAGEKTLQDLQADKHVLDRSDGLRHFMIIIESESQPPTDAYVGVKMKIRGSDVYYYIDKDDVVSQNNFTLVSHFLTIQAVPQTQQLTPTLPVGTSH